MGRGWTRGGPGRRGGLLAALTAVVLVAAYGGPAPLGAGPAGAPVAARAASIQRVYAELPLRFEPNVGQAAGAAEFVARGAGYALLLSPDEALLALRPALSAADRASAHADSVSAARPRDSAGAETAWTTVRMQLVGTNGTPAGEGAAPLPGVVHYYLGSDPVAWRTHVPTYAQVRYRDVYAGVDLVYYGDGGQLEYDFVVAPGADPAQVRLRFPGANAIAVDDQGELVLHVGNATLRQRRPVVYQEHGGARQEIAGGYVLLDDAPAAPAAAPRDVASGDPLALRTPPAVGFAVAAYDRSRPLVIDPVLVYSTYLGGSSNDQGFGISLDGAGNAYVAGSTASANFPAFNTLVQTTYGGGTLDAFVTRLTPSGVVSYSTYLGGTSEEQAFASAADASGNAYVAGYTTSSNFPTTPSAFRRTIGLTLDAFVAKLNTDGTLGYSTYLGGNGVDIANGIAVDGSGNAYVTGETLSTNFPTLGAIQAFPNGANDAFVTKLNPQGSALVYSTYLGGNQLDRGRAIAVDSAGNAYVTGETYSPNFPTQNAAQATFGGGVGPHCGVSLNSPCPDAFVTKLTPAGNGYVYSTYLGGTDADFGRAIAADASGNAYVAGQTFSTQFPRTATFGYCCDQFAFLTKLGASGPVSYSVLLGGLGDTSAQAVAVDSGGNAYVAGYTRATNFPTQDPVQAALAGGQGADAFVAKVNATGNGLIYSTYLGGTTSASGQVEEGAFGLAVDGSGNAFVAGFTQATNFPLRNAWQATLAGGTDAFVTKLNDATATPTAGPSATPTITPSPTATLLPVSCAPRPSVVLATAPGAPGSLQVTVTATGANNLLLALRFGDPRPSSNELIDVGGQTGRSGAFTVTLPPPGVGQTQFTIRRATPGQATTVSFTVVDRCGDWPTLAGGGPSAF